MNLLAKSSAKQEPAKRKELIVIGTGPVGIQFIKSARSCLCDCNITIFGNESWEPYNRVKLSSFFAGQLNWDELVISQKLPQSENLTTHHNCAIVKIDPAKNLVLDENDDSRLHVRTPVAGSIFRASREYATGSLHGRLPRPPGLPMR